MIDSLKTRVFFIALLGTVGAAAGQTGHPSAVWNLNAGELRMRIEGSGARFSFLLDGTQVIAADNKEGILLNGEEANLKTSKPCSPTQCIFQLTTRDGQSGELTVTLSPHHARLLLKPYTPGEQVRFQTGGASPAYGLADQATLNHNYNTDVTGFSDDEFLSGQELSRLVSNFIIYPEQKFAALLVDPRTKIIHSSREQLVQGVAHAGTSVNMNYYFGSPHDIYSEYRLTRIAAGYPVMRPKYEMFGVGWEAFGALGWDTNQKTVRDSVDRYLALGFPLQWIVIGSGFWPSEERFHATTSFGLFDNAKYPDPRALFQHFHDEHLKVLLGLRISFLQDSPFSKEGVANQYFLMKNGTAEVFHGSWPKSPYYLLNAQNPDALNWYLGLVKRWQDFGVDGFKEDYYGFGGFGLRDDKVDPTNTRMMEQGFDIIERNGYLSSNGDLHRINDFNYDQDQDRGPVNALALAYAGFPLVYPDIVGGTFGENHFSVTRTHRMEIYMMRNAQWAALHSSMGMGEPPWSFAKPVGDVMLAAARLHDRLQPYIYSQAVRFSEDGYPWTMTPLPIAFPHDKLTAGHENATVRGYEWMIGDALLATPLYGNDYAEAQTRDVYLPAGTWMDFDTGDIYQGPKMLKGFPLPVGKTPLFVGGSGILIEKENKTFVAGVYPVSKRAEENFSLPDSSDGVKIQLSVHDWKHLQAVDRETGQPVAGNWQNHAYTFAIQGGHVYQVRSEER